jgi:hypothetical protein
MNKRIAVNRIRGMQEKKLISFMNACVVHKFKNKIVCMQTILYFGIENKRWGKMNSKGEIKGQKKTRSFETGLVVISGLEPPTHGFSVRCSTN